MNNFEAPDVTVTMLSGISIINNSNNEFALRIPSVEEAADTDG